MGAVGQSFRAVRNSEFVEYARQARPPLAYARRTAASPAGMEMLSNARASTSTTCPTRGGAPPHSTVAGEVSPVFSGTRAFSDQGGRLRALGDRPQRSALFPIFRPFPVLPGYEVKIWLACLRAAGNAGTVLARLHGGNKALAEPRRGQVGAAGDWSLPHKARMFAALIRRGLREVWKAGERPSASR